MQSGDAVCVRAILLTGEEGMYDWYSQNVWEMIHDDSLKPETFAKFNFFNKNAWFSEPANFVLIDERAGKGGVNDVYGVSEDGIVSFFGTPAERYTKGRYTILVYNKDLSKELGIDK